MVSVHVGTVETDQQERIGVILSDVSQKVRMPVNAPGCEMGRAPPIQVHGVKFGHSVDFSDETGFQLGVAVGH